MVGQVIALRDLPSGRNHCADAFRYSDEVISGLGRPTDSH